MAGSIDVVKILGGLLNQQGGASSSAGGILGNILSGALGGGAPSGRASAAPAGGGLNDLLGGLLGSAMEQFGQQPGAGQRPGSVPSGQFKPDFSRTASAPAPKIEKQEAESQAKVLLKAMINAAKSDGNVDQDEINRIVKQLGDISEAEKKFVRNELSKPLDTEGIIKSVPRGQETNAYAISLLAINLDTNPEARYLHQLAQGLGITPQIANQIHDKLGAPKIYT